VGGGEGGGDGGGDGGGGGVRGGHPGEDGCCDGDGGQGFPLTNLNPRQIPKQSLVRRAGLVEVGRSFKDVVIQDIPGRGKGGGSGKGEARRGEGWGKAEAPKLPLHEH
jgi:hypothetical protein